MDYKKILCIERKFTGKEKTHMELKALTGKNVLGEKGLYREGRGYLSSLLMFSSLLWENHDICFVALHSEGEGSITNWCSFKEALDCLLLSPPVLN